MIVFAPCPKGSQWTQENIDRWMMDWNYHCMGRHDKDTRVASTKLVFTDENSKYQHKAQPLRINRVR